MKKIEVFEKIVEYLRKNNFYSVISVRDCSKITKNAGTGYVYKCINDLEPISIGK